MATKKSIKKQTKKPITAKRATKPVKKTAYKTTAKKPVAKKPVAKKVVAKRVTKPVTKKTTIRKPVSKKTTHKKTNKTKLNKQGLLFVGLGVITAISLGVFILPNVLKTFTKDKPVLGVAVSIPNNAKIPHSSFKDKNFYACVIGNLNEYKINNKTNRTFSYKATDAELSALYTLDCGNLINSPTSVCISNTNGLEKIPNLFSIKFKNNKITSINLTNQTKLQYLDLSYNNLSSINLSNQKELTWLYLSENNLSSINLSNQKELTGLYLSENNLSSINLTNQTKLQYLDLSDNNLSSINLTNQKNLIDLFLYGNKLTSINLTNQTKLQHLGLSYNNLSSLNVTHLKNLTYASATENPFSPSKVRMLTSDYTVSGNNINVNTLNRSTILSKVYPFASKIKINKYIVTASGSKITSGTYKNGDKVVVEALGIKEERPIWVTNPSNPGKITSATWDSIKNSQAGIKFKATGHNQEWYRFTCYYNGKLTVDRTIAYYQDSVKRDGYNYSTKTDYPVPSRNSGVACFVSGGIKINNKNYYTPALTIK